MTTYLEILDKVKTEIWDKYSSEIVSEQLGGSASLASAFNYYYNFYSWLLSNSNIYSTYDSPLTFSNELAKLTQQIVENYNNKSLLTAQNVILTNQNTILTNGNQILTDQNGILTDQNTILTDNGEKLGDIRDDIRVLKGRGESEHLGIVTRHIYMADIHDKHRSALLRMALKDSNMLDDFNRACAEEEVSPIFK
jgi:hypothetical protein